MDFFRFNKIEIRNKALVEKKESVLSEPIIKKTDYYHSQIKIEGKESINDEINPMVLAPILGYRMHLKKCWQNIENSVEIGLIEGTNGTQICISQSLGWENEDWRNFFENGIKLPRAIENCKKYGIKKFVFYCNNEIEELSIDELIS